MTMFSTYDFSFSFSNNIANLDISIVGILQVTGM